MAAALYLKDTDRFNAKEVTIITFGQPGTFLGGDCPDMVSLEDQMYRFVNYKDYDNGLHVTLDPAPAIGGKSMGQTLFLSNDDNRAKMHHYKADVGYGSSVATFDLNARDKARLRAHSAVKYMERIQRFPSNEPLHTSGFGHYRRCRSTDDCKPGYFCHNTDRNQCRPL